MRSSSPLLAVAMVAVVLSPVAAAPPEEADLWSKAVQGVQARVVLVEKPKSNGTRSLVPYLELRNVGDSAHPIPVHCGHVQFELVDGEGKVVREGSSLRRSGPHVTPGIVLLPHDSSMRISMYCSNWGVPRDAPAMISTDSGAWVLKAEEKDKAFLRATIKDEKADPFVKRIVRESIQTPAVRVDWKE